MTAVAAPATPGRAGSGDRGAGRPAPGHWPARLVALAVILGLLVGVSVRPAHALGCGTAAGVPLDDGCLFTITGADTPEPTDGFAVTNAGGVPLWDFVRGKDPQAIGYPISQRWADGPFTLQAFQKVILQWDPRRERMNYYNTLDALATRYPYVALPNVPGHAVLAEDTGADFAHVIRNHLAILEQNDRIKARFLAEPDWLNLYGLPIRYEERAVNGNPLGLQVLRTQRTVFEVWNVPAPGTTPGQVNLQNVPDKIKRLRNVIIPDAAKSPASLLDPALPNEISSLPWVADGVTAVEQRMIGNLRRIASASQPIYSRLLRTGTVPWLQRSTQEHALGATEVLVTIAEFPWSERVRPRLPDHHLLQLMLDEDDEQWPASFRKTLAMPWVRDGVSWDELHIVDEFVYMLRSVATNPWALSYYGKGPELDELIQLMLDMPFLQSVDGHEVYLMRKLSGSGAGFDYFQTAIRSWSRQGGISDDQVLLYMYPGIRPLLDPGDEHPERLPRLLDPARLGITIERREVVFPGSGEMLLVLVRSDYVSPYTMDVLEQETRRIEELMGIPLRSRYSITMIPRVGFDVSTYNAGYYVLVEPWRVHSVEISNATRAEIVNALAGHYWKASSRGRWLVEGAALFLEFKAGYYRREDLPDVNEACGKDRIADLIKAESGNNPCYATLGAHLFLEVADTLGDGGFRSGFARLFRSLGTDGLYCQCGYERSTYIDYFRRAFTTDTTAETAGIVESLISRWYDGQ